MQCESCSAHEIYMCTEFRMNTCKYVWAIHQVFWLCSRGRRRAPVPRPGPSLCGVLMAADSNVCANFQEFLSTLRPPKVPGRLKKKINRKKIIILWKTIGPCALLAWALIILWKSIGPCALLAWALMKWTKDCVLTDAVWNFIMNKVLQIKFIIWFLRRPAFAAFVIYLLCSWIVGRG